MTLDKENFFIKMFIFNKSEIKSYDITNKISGFTNSNSASILGQSNLKYKIMIEELDIKSDDLENPYILFQISINYIDKMYSPLLFLPIKGDCKKSSQVEKDRAISYQLYNHKFSHIWFYLSHQLIDDIIKENLSISLNENNFIRNMQMKLKIET